MVDVAKEEAPSNEELDIEKLVNTLV